MAQRSIHPIQPANTQRLGSGLVTHDATPAHRGADMDPFITVSLYDMRGPTFPPHPHAGFAVATYMLPESATGFVNQDTLGHRNLIAPGALHVTVAGRGVLHEEQPADAGRLARGYQIWIDLPNDQRRIAPHALHLAAPDVPVRREPDADVRVVLGESQGLKSPLALPTPLRLLDVTLRPAASFTQTLGADDNAFVFVLDGALRVNGHDATAGDLVHTAADGDTLVFETAARSARFTLFAGTPLRQPRVQQGPFVAGNPAELQGFMRDFAAGRMGQLTPFAQRPFTPP